MPADLIGYLCEHFVVSAFLPVNISMNHTSFFRFIEVHASRYNRTETAVCKQCELPAYHYLTRISSSRVPVAPSSERNNIRLMLSRERVQKFHKATMPPNVVGELNTATKDVSS